MNFLLNFSHYVKSYEHLCQILAFFTMPALQIWPRHVTQEANFGKILFFPNSALNIEKSCKISSRKALYFRSYQPKNLSEVETPSAFRVKRWYLWNHIRYQETVNGVHSRFSCTFIRENKNFHFISTLSFESNLLPHIYQS